MNVRCQHTSCQQSFSFFNGSQCFGYTLADHREQHATPICESLSLPSSPSLCFPLTLSLSLISITTFFSAKRKEACWKAEGESSCHISPMATDLHHLSRLHKPQLHRLLAVTRYTFNSDQDVLYPCEVKLKKN